MTAEDAESDDDVVQSISGVKAGADEKKYAGIFFSSADNENLLSATASTSLVKAVV